MMIEAAPRVETVVLKFGGTSVRNADAMRRVVAITEAERGRCPVVVTSACSGVTDLLLACARAAGEARLDDALAAVAELRARHAAIHQELAPHDDASREALNALLDEIEQLVHGVVMLGELSARTTDAFASYGERLSSILLAEAFRAAGWRAALADSRSFIITDDTFTEARPNLEAIDMAAGLHLRPLFDGCEVVVAQGFIGSTPAGITTTIGRGGSDHTGALVGAALGAREIQIWTDVSGILTADPRSVPSARVVPTVTFTEARELAYFGAKVIHPDTILPAVERNIPVVIKNSMQPADAGTRIVPDGTPVSPGVHSITVQRGMTLLRLSPRDARQGPAPVQRAIASFAAHEITLHCALFAETRALAAVRASELDDLLMAALEAECTVAAEHGLAILGLTGSELQSAATEIASAIAALEGIPLVFTSIGTSDHLLLIGVPESHATAALVAMHARLFPE